MPAGKVRAGDVAHFAARDQRVERLQHFLNGSQRVESVHVIDVDVIHLEPFEDCLRTTQSDDGEKIRDHWARRHAKSGLRRNK